MVCMCFRLTEKSEAGFYVLTQYYRLDASPLPARCERAFLLARKTKTGIRLFSFFELQAKIIQKQSDLSF